MIKITKRLLKKAPGKFKKPLLVSLVISCAVISVLVPLIVALTTSSILLWIPTNFICQYACFILIQCFLGEFMKLSQDIQAYSIKMNKPNILLPYPDPALTDFLCKKINLLPESLQFRVSMVLYAGSVTLFAFLPKIIFKLFVPFITVNAITLPLSILCVLICVSVFIPISQFYYWNTILIPEIEEMRK